MLELLYLMAAFVAAFALGEKACRALNLTFSGDLEELVFSSALGLGLLGLLFFFLGAARLFYLEVFAAIFSLILVFSVAELKLFLSILRKVAAIPKKLFSDKFSLALLAL